MNRARAIARLVLAALALAGLVAGGGCQQGGAPSPLNAPTATPRPTDVSPSETTPPPTATVAPTSTAVIEMKVREVSPGGETDLLKLLEVSREEVDKAQFEAKNPGLKLLVPPDKTTQAFVQFKKDDEVWVMGNFNLPVSEGDQDKLPPVFNTPDFGFLMGRVDSKGNWFYHVPLRPGEEGKAPVVYQRRGELYSALVDLATGKIDPQTISPYWRPMPKDAVQAVMAKYGDAVYVTFWRADGTQIEEARTKVCDLPPEPTIPKEEILDLPGLERVWNSRNTRWEYVDVDNQIVAYWNAEQKRIEIIATILTEKHIGLFRPISLTEAQAAFEASWPKGDSPSTNAEIKIPLPFDPRGIKFKVAEYDLADNFVALGIEVPEGTVFYCPLKGQIIPLGSFEKPCGWGINLVDETRNIIFINTASGEKLVSGMVWVGDKPIPIFKSGDPNKKLMGFGGKFPIQMASYSHDGKITIGCLSKTSSGLIGFITP